MFDQEGSQCTSVAIRVSRLDKRHIITAVKCVCNAYSTFNSVYSMTVKSVHLRSSFDRWEQFDHCVPGIIINFKAK